MVKRLKRDNNKDIIKRIERQEKLFQKLIDILIKRGIIKDEV